MAGPFSEADLAEHLADLFPLHEVRVETGDGLLAVSVHPDLVPEEAVFEVFDWFETRGAAPDNDSIGVSHLLESEVGPLGYPP